ncbi:MAG: hypothetical protein P8129_08245 [Anaerolineae bacterium]|jgi:hypothetical protein
MSLRPWAAAGPAMGVTPPLLGAGEQSGGDRAQLLSGPLFRRGEEILSC